MVMGDVIMSRQYNENILYCLLTHHLVVRVDKVSTPVAVSPHVEAGQVLHPALAVIDCHPGLGVESSRQDDCRFHLDTAGVPDGVVRY